MPSSDVMLSVTVVTRRVFESPDPLWEFQRSPRLSIAAIGGGFLLLRGRGGEGKGEGRRWRGKRRGHDREEEEKGKGEGMWEGDRQGTVREGTCPLFI